MVRLISSKRGGLAALKLTKLFGIDDFPAAKDSGKVLIIIIYCYLIIIIGWYCKIGSSFFTECRIYFNFFFFYFATNFRSDTITYTQIHTRLCLRTALDNSVWSIDHTDKGFKFVLKVLNWRLSCKKGVYRFFGRFSFFAGSS